MPTFTFSGFSVGSSVAISASQGAISAARSVPTWGQQGAMGTVDILKTTQQVVTAPAPVWLEAIGLSGFNVTGGPGPGGTHDPSFHGITFIWTVKDQAPAPYPRVENMVSDWNNANIAYGKKVCFRFPNPGVYDIDLWCVDSDGTTGTATTQVTVLPATYSPGNTIVFARDGNFAGAPSGQQVTTMAALNAALNGRTNPTRVSFKPGETITDTEIAPNSGNLARIDTWSPGQQVTLKGTDFQSTHLFLNDEYPGGDLSIVDIHWAGDWDPRTETGDPGPFSCFAFTLIANPVNMIFHNCDWSGLNFVDVGAGQTAVGTRMLFSDCVCKSWRGYWLYSFWNERGYYGLLGCVGAQDPQALGGGPKNDMSNDHGPLRLERQEHVYIACSDFFNCCGWSGAPGGWPAANACLRINSKGYDNWSAIMDRVVAEGGYIQLKVGGENDGTVELPGNFLADKCLFIGSARSLGFADLQFGGTTLRNCLYILPDSPNYENFSAHLIDAVPDNPSPANDTPFAIYNTTFYVARPEQWGLFSEANTFFSNFITENNIYHLPNAPSPVTGDGPIDETTPIPGITPRFAQVRWNYPFITGSASVPNGGTLTIPYASIGLQDITGNGPAGSTDQAYWQARLAAGDNRHMIVFTGTGPMFATRGNFTVSYDDPVNIVITNTSGGPWNGNFELRLDRKSDLRPALTQYKSPDTLPTCRPLGPIGPGPNTATFAYDDFGGVVRVQPVAAGAVEI